MLDQNNFTEENFNKAKKSLFKLGGLVVAGLLSLFVALDSYGVVDAGYYHVVQNSITGKLTPQMEEGIYMRVPFFNKTTKYKRVFTAEFGDGGEFTSSQSSIPVQFADTYTASVPATFRFKLSSDPEQLLTTHREFRTFDNLKESLITKNAKNVTVVTATQYTGEVFFQGGLNSFKNKLEDQLQNGLYQTERRKVVIESAGNAAVSVDNEDANKVEKQTQLVWKNVVLVDDNGMPKRLRNPLEMYGVTVTQVTIDKPVPEDRLNILLQKKKELVAQRISAEQSIVTAKAEAKAAAQQMEIEKQKAIQVAQKEKSLAVIAEKKKVDIERQQAELQLVKKEKELKMAQADRDIQKAAAQAAQYEAQKIEATGLAQAKVDKALLAAKESSKDIYMAEIQLEMAKIIYPNLKGVNIDMPDYVVNGGADANLPNSLDLMTSLSSMRMLKSQE